LLFPTTCSQLSGGALPWRLQNWGLKVPVMDSNEDITEAPNSEDCPQWMSEEYPKHYTDARW
jgi:hypothetical protein